jgi:hypothetical protein
MKAMEVYENLTPAIVERIEEIVGNKPEPEPDWR